MDDILVVVGIVITAMVAILCIAYHSVEKPWRNSILAFFPLFITGWAFFNWQWWVTLLAAVGEALAIHIVSSLFHRHMVQAEDARDFATMIADIDHAIEASKAKENTTTLTSKGPSESSSTTQHQEHHDNSIASTGSTIASASPQEPVKSTPIDAEKNASGVKQTLLSCLHCGRKLSDSVCENCGYDHTRKILLLNRIDPRKLQLSKK